MFRILDRYIIRELLLPFLIGLLVFTFLLLIQPLAEQGERLIAKGVSWQLVARVLMTLVPQALAVTIPIALLIGLLIAFGRLSADRESVALQACGISIYRMLRPVLIIATVAWAVTSYVMFVAVPSANQTFREIVYGSCRHGPRTTSSRASSSRTSPTACCTCATRPRAAAAGSTSSWPTPRTLISRPSSPPSAAAWSSIAQSAPWISCSRTARGTRPASPIRRSTK